MSTYSTVVRNMIYQSRRNGSGYTRLRTTSGTVYIPDHILFSTVQYSTSGTCVSGHLTRAVTQHSAVIRGSPKDYSGPSVVLRTPAASQSSKGIITIHVHTGTLLVTTKIWMIIMSYLIKSHARLTCLCETVNTWNF